MLNKKFESENFNVTLHKNDLIELVNFCLQKEPKHQEYFPPHLNIKQLSRYLNYSEAAIYRMVGNAEIPSYKIAGKLLFKKSEIDDWLSDFKQHTIKNRMALLDSNDK